MAEGGEEDDNPFSYKHLVKDKDEKTSSDEEEVDRPVPNLPDVSGFGPPGHSEPEEEDDRRPRRDDREENPFSFKKFIQSSGRSKRPAGPHSGPNYLTTLDLANDLPDFVQDHYSSGSGCGTGASDSPRIRQRNPATEAAPLPDFALDSANCVNLPAASVEGACNEGSRQENHAAAGANIGLDLPVLGAAVNDGGHVHHGEPVQDVGYHEDIGLSAEGAGARPRTNFNAHGPLESSLAGAPLPDIHNDTHRHSDGIVNHVEEAALPLPPAQHAGSSGGLPDCLPDSVIGGVGARPKVQNNVVENGLGLLGGVPDHDLPAQAILGDASPELRRLQRENQELRRQLLEARETIEEQAARAAVMKQEIEALKRREAEETATLENMVQQVESNLLTSTQRAAKAENTIAKLRQEVHSLQSQAQSLSLENDALRGGANVAPDDVLREKARYASEQLATAAKNAEITIKQLLSGVDTLKMVSDVLASIDKVSDIDGGSSSRSDEPRGAEGGL